MMRSRLMRYLFFFFLPWYGFFWRYQVMFVRVWITLALSAVLSLAGLGPVLRSAEALVLCIATSPSEIYRELLDECRMECPEAEGCYVVKMQWEVYDAWNYYCNFCSSHCSTGYLPSCSSQLFEVRCVHDDLDLIGDCPPPEQLNLCYQELEAACPNVDCTPVSGNYVAEEICGIPCPGNECEPECPTPCP